MHKLLLSLVLLLPIAATAQTVVYGLPGGASATAQQLQQAQGAAAAAQAEAQAARLAAQNTVPKTGGVFTGNLNAMCIGAECKADQFPGASPSQQVDNCDILAKANVNAGSGPTVCDARMLTGVQHMTS